MKIHFLKTIWSDIILLEQEGLYAMVDTGFEEQFPQIREYLDSLGVQRLEFILLTHFHRDHYGSIASLIQHYKVGKVYFKEYSGLDCTTAWGSVADDAYRASETEKYEVLKALIETHSTLVPVEGLGEVPFGPLSLLLYHTANSIRQIFEDTTHPETYHQIAFSENQNSLGVYFEVEGKSVFLGGDLLDHESSHPLAHHSVCQIAKEIGHPVNLYKYAHHATYNTGCVEALKLLKPDTVVITNKEPYVTDNSDALKNLQEANPRAKIYFTQHQNQVFLVGADGIIPLSR